MKKLSPQQEGALILLTGMVLGFSLHGHLPRWGVVLSVAVWGVLLIVVLRALRKRST